MTNLNKFFAGAAFTALALGVLPSMAGDDDYANVFVKMCATSSDGMVTKAQVMQTVERVFDKHDTERRGTLNKKQAEFFAKELAKMSGA